MTLIGLSTVLLLVSYIPMSDWDVLREVIRVSDLFFATVFTLQMLTNHFAYG